MGKYKIKKRKKAQSPMLIFIAFAICMLCVTYSYSILTDNISIVGKANLKPEVKQVLSAEEIYEPLPEASEYANSKYTFKNVSNWKQGDGTYIYQINLEITNLEQDFSSGNLEISFEEINGLFESQSQNNLGITQAEKVLISGNKITILFKEANSKIKYGDKISILAYLTYENELPEGVTINNITLNGKLLIEDNNTSVTENMETDFNNEITNTQNTSINKPMTNTVTNVIVKDSNIIESETTLNSSEEESKKQIMTDASQSSLLPEEKVEKEDTKSQQPIN